MTDYALTDEVEAKGRAQQISTGQPGSTVHVKSVVVEPAGEWTRIVGTYVDGRPQPWVWTVTFLGPLTSDDHSRLAETDISYMSSSSVPGPAGIRAGLSRHRLAVEATEANEAADKVHAALGPLATSMTDWTSVPGDDQAIRFRLGDSRRPESSRTVAQQPN
ncbi:MAG TPA: hypothetical protein VI318_11690 [Baekduia sp.]